MKGFLLDICTFLWAVLEPEKVSLHTSNLIKDPDTLLFLSPISVWEIEVKFRLGKLRLRELSPREFVLKERKRLEVFELPFSEASALRHEQLSPIHRDPYDRMLICQAIEHDLTILSPDSKIRAYDVNTEW